MTQALAVIVVVATVLDLAMVLGVTAVGGSVKQYRANPAIAIFSFLASLCATALAFTVVF